MTYETEQEEFWAGDFGTQYIDRNNSAQLLASNLNFFARALRAVGRIESCLEFGANIGMNLRALMLLYPHLMARGIEINVDAARQLGQLLGDENVYQGSLFDYQVHEPCDLVLTKGVLIHLNPSKLQLTYKKLYESSRRWILVCEYYNPTPTLVTYRGHDARLYKRDFAGDLLEAFPDLHLIDYGFAYRRDPAFPQDDITWFLLQKTN
jgi:pseudaminic acid biosynthesis-associated methylase